MSKDPVPVLPPTAAPVVIVKDGTTSTDQDRLNHAQRVDAERRRAADDHARAVPGGVKLDDRGFRIHRVGALDLLNGSSPKLVLHYRNADGSIRQACESEITQEDDGRGGLVTMFAMVCPKCVGRGVAMGHAQMLIRDSHRKFHLDTSKAGPRVLEYSYGFRKELVVAGTVTCDDVIKCDAAGCGYRVRIDDSNVWEV